MNIDTTSAAILRLVAYLVLEILILFPLSVVSVRQDSSIAVTCITLAGIPVCLALYQLRSRPTLSPGATLTLLWTGGITLRILGLSVPPSLSDDLYRYLWEGHVIQHGFNPFLLAPSSPLLDAIHTPLRSLVNHPEIPSVYPPVAQALFVLLDATRLGGMAAQLLFTGWDLGLLYALTKLQRREGRPLWPLFAYAWHPLAALESASSGHLDSAAICLLVAGLLFLTPARADVTPEAAPSSDPGTHPVSPLRGWLFVTLSALTKLLPLPLLGVLWLQTWRAGARRQTLLAIAACVALSVLVSLPFCLPSVLSGGDVPPNPQALLQGLQTYAQHWRFNPSLFEGLSWLLEWLGGPGIAADWSRRLTQLLFGAWLLFWGWRGCSPGRLAYRSGYAFFLLSPTAHPWYLLWAMALWPVYGLRIGTLEAISHAKRGSDGESPAMRRPSLGTRFILAWEGPGLLTLSLTISTGYIVFSGVNGWAEPTGLALAVYLPPFFVTAWTALRPGRNDSHTPCG